MNLKIRYTVVFETEIEVPDGTDEKSCCDLFSYIDIPENRASKYVPNTFQVVWHHLVPSDKGRCQRCGNKLDEKGYCKGATCPFSDHQQSCLGGWAGHPDKAIGPSQVCLLHCNETCKSF